MTSELAPIRIDLASPVPAYRQIANALRPLLVSGRLQVGDQLPPVRQLAVDLGVHHNTVAEAYRILAAEGWLDLRRRRGVTILDRRDPAPHHEAGAAFSRRLEELVAEARGGGLAAREIARRMSAAVATVDALAETE
jgi:DNA-binding transcriptional regulator YhcF (GntR family)